MNDHGDDRQAVSEPAQDEDKTRRDALSGIVKAGVVAPAVALIVSATVKPAKAQGMSLMCW
jgi:hypothetical protein